MPTNKAELPQSPGPVTDYFEGEYLELSWRYLYRPEFIPLLLDYLNARPGMRILEAGCGTGVLTRLLARNLDDIQVVGFDGDGKMLALARQALEHESLNAQVQLCEADAYHIPYPDETFDLVTSQTLL